MTFITVLGVVGVCLVLGAYLALQTGRMPSTSPWFSAANAAGAALILVSLAVDFNLPAALIEGAWLLISIFGLIRSLSENH